MLETDAGFVFESLQLYEVLKTHKLQPIAIGTLPHSKMQSNLQGPPFVLDAYSAYLASEDGLAPEV